MCEPATLALAAAAVTAAGTIVSGVNTRKSLRYAAKISDRNAALDRAAAQDALERGRIEEERQGRRTRALLGDQRAAAAANGVEVDFGSMGYLQDDTRMVGFEDAQTIRQNAMRESKGYEISAWNRKADASAKRAQGGAAMWASVFEAGGTLLNAGSQFGKAQAANYNGGSSGNGVQGGAWLPSSRRTGTWG